MLQNSGGIAGEQVKLLQLLSTELIKNIEGRLQTDVYSEERILKESLNEAEAMKKIKRGRRNALLVTPRCNRLHFNFDMCNEMYYEIASYLELRDLIALTTTCRKSADVFQGYRFNIDCFSPATYSWFQRCKIFQNSATCHTVLGNVHERNSPISCMITCLRDRFFVVGGYDGNISIWESNADPTCSVFPTCRKMVKAHDGWILNLTKISSSVFASSSSDGSVKLWCVESILGINCEEGASSNAIVTTVVKERGKSKLTWMNVIPCLHTRAKCAIYMPTDAPPNCRLYNGVSVEKKDPLATIKTTSELVEGICSVDSTLFVAGSEGSLTKHRVIPTIAFDNDTMASNESKPNKLSVVLSRMFTTMHSGISHTNETGDFNLTNITALNDGMLVGISRKGINISVFNGKKWVTAYSTGGGYILKSICALPSGGFTVWSKRGDCLIFRDVDRTPFYPSMIMRSIEFKSVEISATFALDDRYIVLGSMDHSLSLYDLQAAQMVGTIRKAHSGFVTSITYLPGTRCIVSGGLDGSIRVTRLDFFGSIELISGTDDNNSDSSPVHS